MAINYTILKSSIVNSSIWNEDSDTRVVWITMLAMRNKEGEIFASVGGLAHQARVSKEKTREALAKFMAPEEDSSSRDDGRRIEEIPGGWRLLNHDRIKQEAQEASRTTYMAKYMAERREKRQRSKPGQDGKPASSVYKTQESAACQAQAEGRLDEHFQPVEQSRPEFECEVIESTPPTTLKSETFEVITEAEARCIQSYSDTPALLAAQQLEEQAERALNQDPELPEGL